MQFLSSSLETLVKNLSGNGFKYLTEEFGSKNLELLKQKVYKYMGSFKRFKGKNCLILDAFTALSKMEQLVIMVKD